MPALNRGFASLTTQSHRHVGKRLTLSETVLKLRTAMGKEKRNYGNWIAPGISVFAFLAIVVHQVWPELKADGFTLAMTVIIVLPWLTGILKSVKLPGGIEFELREQIREVRATAESAEHQAEVAIATANAPTPPLHNSSDATSSDLGEQELMRQAGEYVALRKSLPPGEDRTLAMSAQMGKMLAVARQMQRFEYESRLKSSSPGERLAGYAYVHAHPTGEKAEPVVRAILSVEDTPFGQYWALRALRRIASSQGAAAFVALCLPLRTYGAGLKKGTDRSREFEHLWREVGCE